MTIEILGTVIGFIILVGGLGFKLSSELSSIKNMLEIFITKAEAKFEIQSELKKTVENHELRLVTVEKKHYAEDVSK